LAGVVDSDCSSAGVNSFSVNIILSFSILVSSQNPGLSSRKPPEGRDSERRTQKLLLEKQSGDSDPQRSVPVPVRFAALTDVPNPIWMLSFYA
jgi:hypothetical protein